MCFFKEYEKFNKIITVFIMNTKKYTFFFGELNCNKASSI